MTITKTVMHMSTAHRWTDTRIFERQVTWLAKAGFAVTLLARTHPGRDLVGIPPHVRVITLNPPSSRLSRMLIGPVQALVIGLKDRHSIYHLHDPELIPVGIAIKAVTLGRAKVVYDVHEHYPRAVRDKGWIPWPLRAPLSRAVWLAERLAERFFDGVVCANEGIARQFSCRRRILVRNFPPSTGTRTAPRKHRPGTRVIYAGLISEHRGIPQLVAAMAQVRERVPGATLKLMGRMDPPSLLRRLEGIQGWEAVDYLGEIPHEQVLREYDEADLGVVPFLPGGHHDVFSLPNKLFEYMSSGLPIVASNFRHWDEILAASRAGVTVDPTDPKEIARAVALLLEQDDRREEMSRAARTSSQNYIWEGEVERLVGLYDLIGQERAN